MKCIKVMMKCIKKQQQICLVISSGLVLIAGYLGSSQDSIAKASTLQAAQAQSCGQVSFTNTGIDVNSRSYALTTGDFDGDGKTDLATANYFSGNTSDNVTILFLNENGGFDRSASYQFGALPSAISAADFNRDGKLDLAVCYSGSNTVDILFNDGHGAFPRASAFAINNPRGLAVGDFNGDGSPDLAVTEFGSVYLWVIPVNGDGGFEPAERYIVGQDPISVTAGDFNRDGRLDLATANFSSSTISVLSNRGGGKFDTPVNYSVGGAPESITLGDFNSDHKADLAVASANTNAIWVYLNNPDGSSFQPPKIYPVGNVPTAVATTELNLDGKDDLIVANLGDNTVFVLLNDRGQGFINTTTIRVGERPVAIAVGDFKADGKPDFAVANSGATGVSVLLNTTICAPVISTVTTIQSSPNPSRAWHVVHFRINVFATEGRTVPTGKVQLLERGVPISPWLSLHAGKVKFSTNDFNRGLHKLTARYSGDALHQPSSRQIWQVVYPR